MCLKIIWNIKNSFIILLTKQKSNIMGLDIYLSHYSNYHQSKANEEAYEKMSENLYEAVQSVEGKELTEDSRKRITETLEKEAEKLGLDSWGCDETYRTRVELDSKLYPEHMFKIGYFRSSYNDSGINRILKDLSIPNLYDIFPHDDEYEFCPDWNHALDVVQQSIRMFKEDKGYRVETVSANMFAPDQVMKNPAQALEVFNAKLGEKNSYKWFSNRDGYFYLDKKGLTVHALMPGKDMLDRPCTYAIYKIKDGNKSYLEALEIVKETIEYVLEQKDPQSYYLRWSS
jgi:hypothetical protein